MSDLLTPAQVAKKLQLHNFQTSIQLHFDVMRSATESKPKIFGQGNMQACSRRLEDGKTFIEFFINEVSNDLKTFKLSKFSKDYPAHYGIFIFELNTGWLRFAKTIHGKGLITIEHLVIKSPTPPQQLL